MRNGKYGLRKWEMVIWIEKKWNGKYGLRKCEMVNLD